MTGYGYAEQSNEQWNATVEVKSVNNRYLDVNVTLPGSLSPLEPHVREVVSRGVSRGRVDVFVRLRELQEDLEVYVDQRALSGYTKALNELREAAGIEAPIAIEHLLSFDAVIKSERLHDRNRYWDVINPLLETAMSGFLASRGAEGDRLETDISSQLGRVEATVHAVAGHADEIDTQVRRNLGERFREVVGESVEESRMLAEVATQLTRFSINEELVRLRAHLDSFRTTMVQEGAVGKKLDFLCQEMHREINTIGSKSIVLAISEQVVEAKDALENVREQLRNVE